MVTLDWNNLPFGYIKANYNIRCYFKDGKWSEPEISDSEFINIHIAATGLHYGQEAFEGLKAYRGRDGKIRLFRWEDNARRLHSSALGVKMEPVPIDIFREAIFTAVRLNEKFVPPYGSGASLYIRPLLYGSGAEVGVKPSSEYTFIVFVTPVGPYFKGGVKPVNMLMCRDVDRAAPLGTGNIKVGGNYAASLRAIVRARDEGYGNALFLDAKEKKYIDECGPLPSITNKSLQAIAQKMGIRTEIRRIPVEELAEFEETGACGTAAVISPIAKIIDAENGKIYEYCRDGKPGPVSLKLFNKLIAIQYGDEPDEFGWVTIVEL
ncbi:MAG: branched-chain-amino-acid transaminase [Bacteroidales bacterium]|nr:branched-chain-amino-acid transaminase [Bacteroidales bacterium]